MKEKRIKGEIKKKKNTNVPKFLTRVILKHYLNYAKS